MVDLDLPRVFFLGAGFSVPAGLPIAADLLPHALREVKACFPEESKLDRGIDEYLAFRKATSGTADSVPIDLEDLSDYLAYEHFLGLRGSDTWSDEGNEDQLMLRWGVGAAVHHLTPSAGDLPELYLDFARRLRPRDLVVTFNYDLVLERSLEAVGAKFRRFPFYVAETGFLQDTVDDERGRDDIRLLKMHGSVDWVSSAPFERARALLRQIDPRSEELHIERNRVFGPNAVSPLHRLADDARGPDDPFFDIFVLEDPSAYYASMHWVSAPPLLLTPSPSKLLYSEGLRALWRGLPSWGMAWSGLNIIGYSMPAADPYAMQVLYELSNGYVLGRTNSTGWRLGKQSRIKVVDLRHDEAGRADLLTHYRFLDRDHTDFIFTGFDHASLDAIFGED